MPAAQLLSSVLESAINKLLTMDDAAPNKLAKLHGKRLQVSLSELHYDLLFVFSSSVDVLSVAKMTPEQANKLPDDIDCLLATSLFTLPELKDVANITQLIKQDKLNLLGDIQVAQQFSHVLKSVEIDWEEQLAKYTGDVVAHELSQAAQRLKKHFLGFLQRTETTLRDAALEEKNIAATEAAVDDFCGQVSAVQQRTQQLESRLSRLIELAK
ncbi:ubiquinone biosynthesis accessory factor UbiJ [Planctobacterium marinum]|uniref:Ubiquinone biosynthesis accessory factor UbiJ n=1 Tax=Planctobacterium marinum TaxID=1631968 RepID=A0AA48HLC4_9ALTE|nr:SCP2 domain-containing protein [Planctobacterium marinum]